MKIGDLVRDIEDSELGIVVGFAGDFEELIKVLRFCGRYDNMWVEELEAIA
mgnify:CR=1 FL=1